ncbi:ABC transporter ATP-binding protein [Iamia sp. SCSIO 61187]|uniref:ABC transporter ATP-binding protein n=1 Tax=Iamia sp. SCSIO 61187 TaxID=2722752 RepID=UPI001C6363F1|nr:ABC transporter ATP-binding protein [Iamia sp. SCSIO 61187]QYG94044.1 ABC transporter ATP-binding protein [Iamia sp. SCSIO 61187]
MPSSSLSLDEAEADASAFERPAGDSPPILRFEQTSKVFPDGTEAVVGADLAVHPGELVSIVGPSGCGKSTLLRIAAGLDDATGGTVTVDRSNVGYVFQDANLLPWRTVRRNVELFLQLRGVPAEERRERVDRALITVGLTDFADHHPKSLSGGMRMRVSLARSLTLDPPLFLFDEPFGALDEITRERLNDELLSLFTARSFGGLFVTHSVYEAVFLSTHVAVMSARPGRIVEIVDVPFDYPRRPELRHQPEFARITGRVSEILRSVHR